MSSNYIQLSLDVPGGKKVDTSEVTVGANQVHRQRVVLSSDTASGNIATVSAGGALNVEMTGAATEATLGTLATQATVSTLATQATLSAANTMLGNIETTLNNIEITGATQATLATLATQATLATRASETTLNDIKTAATTTMAKDATLVAIKDTAGVIVSQKVPTTLTMKTFQYSGTPVASAETLMVAAPGLGFRHVVTHVNMSVTSATTAFIWMHFTPIVSATNCIEMIGGYYTGTSNIVASYPAPFHIKGGDNEAIYIKSGGTTTTGILIHYYTEAV